MSNVTSSSAFFTTHPYVDMEYRGNLFQRLTGYNVKRIIQNWSSKNRTWKYCNEFLPSKSHCWNIAAIFLYCWNIDEYIYLNLCFSSCYVICVIIISISNITGMLWKFNRTIYYTWHISEIYQIYCNEMDKRKL